jgi:GT2 family glycosyltransferase
MPRAIPSVLIGVHLTAASQDLFDTLRALHETTAQPFDVVILVDPGPGEAAALIATLEPLRQVRQLTVLAPGGGPASFNRLVSQAADIYVFIEAGARPGPDWLSLMLAALDADSTNGLAGPSTNRCWNEQSVAPNCGASALDVERQSKALLLRHGAAWRSMAPLYSLSDFCLAIRSEVVAVIGAADTEYGRGPCWEMDYGVRAASGPRLRSSAGGHLRLGVSRRNPRYSRSTSVSTRTGSVGGGRARVAARLTMPIASARLARTSPQPRRPASIGRCQ